MVDLVRIIVTNVPLWLDIVILVYMFFSFFLALNLVKLGFILGVSGIASLVVAVLSFFIYQCLGTVEHSKIMLGITGVIFDFLGGEFTFKISD